MGGGGFRVSLFFIYTCLEISSEVEDTICTVVVERATSV